MPKPTISLIIPVYNRPQMIADCLRSLPPSLPCLEEVIVVDDGSTDGQTPEAVRRTIAELGAGDRIRLIEQPNAGPGAARNTGAEAARGDWLVFLDSDDLWLPWTGDILQTMLERNPEAVTVFLNARPFQRLDEPGGWVDRPASADSHSDFFALSQAKPRLVRVGGGYFGIRRALFQEQGGFVPQLRGSEESDLYYRIARSGRFLALEQPELVARRTGIDDSLTHNMAAVFEGLDFLMVALRSGRYGPITPGLEASFADLMGFWIHVLFYGGWGKEGYRLLLRQGGFGILWRQGHRKKALKLLFIPLLALLRPKNHRFRWRPRAA